MEPKLIINDIDFNFQFKTVSSSTTKTCCGIERIEKHYEICQPDAEDHEDHMTRIKIWVDFRKEKMLDDGRLYLPFDYDLVCTTEADEVRYANTSKFLSKKQFSERFGNDKDKFIQHLTTLVIGLFLRQKGTFDAVMMAGSDEEEVRLRVGFLKETMRAPSPDARSYIPDTDGTFVPRDMEEWNQMRSGDFPSLRRISAGVNPEERVPNKVRWISDDTIEYLRRQMMKFTKAPPWQWTPNMWIRLGLMTFFVMIICKFLFS